jgi:hypothetical protein
MTINFVSTAPYAQYVIDGTRGGALITPTQTMALRWANPGGGYRFAASVTRGATPENHFNRVVALELELFIRETFRNAIVIIAT